MYFVLFHISIQNKNCNVFAFPFKSVADFMMSIMTFILRNVSPNLMNCCLYNSEFFLDFQRKVLINEQEIISLYNLEFILYFVLGVNGIIEVINDRSNNDIIILMR